jgi:hypothetical protein
MAVYKLHDRLEKIIKTGDLQESYQIVKVDRANNCFVLIYVQGQNKQERILESQESLDRFYTIVEKPQGHTPFRPNN